MVEGVVKDNEGLPLEGAAIHIGMEVAYTDDSGRFQIRFRRRKPQALQVVTEEFLFRGSFEVVQAPAYVQPDPEDHAADVIVVMRRALPKSTKSQSQSPQMTGRQQSVNLISTKRR